MAAAAFEREAEKRGAEGRRPVVDVGDAVFLFDRAPLALLLVQPVERRGETLLVGRIREQIARQLPERELVPGEAVVERLDHPVAPRPHVGPGPVHLEAVAVGVAGEVHPVGGHPLAIARAGEQPVEQPFVGLGRRVGHEGLDLRRRGRQAGEVEAGPADERGPIRLGLQRESAIRQPGRYEPVEWLARGIRVCRQLGFDGRDECPVRLVRRPFGDPAGEELHLRLGEPADLGLRRRHHAVGIGGDDAGDEFAGPRIPGHDRPRAALQFRAGLLGDVEPQARLPLGGVGTMAGEAAVGQDRPDVAVERDPRRLPRSRGLGGARTPHREHAREQHRHQSWEGEAHHEPAYALRLYRFPTWPQVSNVAAGFKPAEARGQLHSLGRLKTCPHVRPVAHTVTESGRRFLTWPQVFNLRNLGVNSTSWAG